MEQLLFGGLIGIVLMVIVNRLFVPPAPNIIVTIPQAAPPEPQADGCMPIIVICMIVVVVLWLSGAF
jgi:hypothetical protein